MIDWQRKNSKQQVRHLRSLVSASLVGFAFSVLPTSSAVASEKDYDNWYQVEIVVYALKKPSISDENWALENLTYPADMLSISPTSQDLIKPLTLQQLNNVIDHEQLVPVGAGTQQVDSNDDYLFSSRRRRSNVAANDSTGNATDSETAYPTVNANDLSQSPDMQEVGEFNASLERSAEELNRLFNNNRPIAYKELDPAENDLSRIVRSINRSSLYRLLTHKSWHQPVVSEADATPVLLQAGHHYDDYYEIDGTIKLSRSRFLHLSTDLWYTEFSPLYNTSNGSIEALQVLDIDPTLAKANPKVVQWENNRNRYLPVHSHPLKQSRRMRSETLHFIDHPYFGILVSVKGFDYAAEDLDASINNSD